MASRSGNLVRLGEASPVAIATWRLLLATAIFLPVAGRRLGELRLLARRDLLLLLFAGVLLALHFFAWIAAVQRTTVASAAMFSAVNPMLTAGAAALLSRERVGPRLLAAMALGLAGVALLGAGDFGLESRQLAGDALALACGAIFSVYLIVNKRLRQRLSTATHVTGLYGVAALFSLACLIALGEPLVDYSPMTWLCFTLMALGPTGIGHTAINHALLHLPAGWVSSVTLAEPLLAGLVAYFAWGERITPLGLAGYVLICLCVLLLALDRRRPRPLPQAGVPLTGAPVQ